MCFITNLIKKIFGNKKESQPQNIETNQVPQIIVPNTIKKRAICYGINNYPGGANDLRGCLNDVENWSSLLKEVYKFDDISKITDSNCTKDFVTTIINEAITNSNPGDVLVIQNSSHGSYVVDKTGDEMDSRDEVICLYDSFLLDDQFREMLSKIKELVNVIIIADCCFSGTNTRAFDKDVYCAPRFMPPKNFVTIPPKTRSKVFKSIGQTEEEMNHILLSAASDTQTAADAFINQKFCGAFSHFAIKILRENPNVTYNEFYEKLRKYLPSGEYQQTPQLEGKSEFKNRLIFS